MQCVILYAQMDEKTGDAMEITKAIPLPALNVSTANWRFFLRLLPGFVCMDLT